MKFLIRSTPVIILFIMLLGIFQIDMSPHNVLTPAAEASTREAARTILTGDTLQIRSILPQSIPEEEVEAFMLSIKETMKTSLPEPVTGELQLVHAENRRSGSTSEAIPIYRASYEVQRANDFVLVEVAVTDGTAQTSGLTWFWIRDLDSAITGTNDFDSVPLTATRIIFLIAVVINVLFIVVTAVFVIADSAQPRRWLWTLFTLAGMWGLTLNWTTGAILPNFIYWDSGNLSVSLIKFKLFGAGIVRSSYMTAWILEIGLPLGALIYWWRRNTRGLRLAKAQQQEQQQAQEQEQEQEKINES